MNKKLLINFWTASTTVLIVLGCLTLLVSSDSFAHCKGKHTGNHEHCQGDDGGSQTSEIAVETTFNCPTGVDGNDDPIRNCPAGDSSSFQADDVASPYIHDVNNVRNLFNGSGYFVLTMHKRQNRPGTRKVFWDLPQAVALPSGLVTMGTEDLESQGKNHKTIIQVGKFTNVDLRALAPAPGPGNVALDVDMLLDLVVFNGNKQAGNDIVMVHYSPDGNNCDGFPTSGVTVERTDMGAGPRQWTITAAAGSIACMYTFDLNYEFLPFGLLVLTVEEKL